MIGDSAHASDWVFTMYDQFKCAVFQQCFVEKSVKILLIPTCPQQQQKYNHNKQQLHKHNFNYSVGKNQYYSIGFLKLSKNAIIYNSQQLGGGFNLWICITPKLWNQL